MRQTLFVVVTVGVLVVAGSSSYAKTVGQPASPSTEGRDYTQKLITERVLKKRLAVARFGDNIPVVESPFGQKKQEDIVGEGVAIHKEEMEPEGVEPSRSFTPRLIQALAETGQFILIEREDINSLLREVSFGESRWVDKKKSAKVGKVLGAQIIVTGALGLNMNPETKRYQRLELLLRMYDVETSRIVGTAKTTGRTEDQVIERAVLEIVAVMDRVPWVGKIASVSGKKYYLNAGRADNIAVGNRFQIFSLGKKIKDPSTKEVIGFEEELAGVGEVVSVAERTATLKVLKPKRKIRVGDKVQPAQE